eukprot:478924_1
MKSENMLICLNQPIFFKRKHGIGQEVEQVVRMCRDGILLRVSRDRYDGDTNVSRTFWIMFTTVFAFIGGGSRATFRAVVGYMLSTSEQIGDCRMSLHDL